MRDGKLGPNTQVMMHLVDTVNTQAPHWHISPPSELAGEYVYWTNDNPIKVQLNVHRASLFYQISSYEVFF